MKDLNSSVIFPSVVRLGKWITTRLYFQESSIFQVKLFLVHMQDQ